MDNPIQIIRRCNIDPDQHLSDHFTWSEFLCKCGKCDGQYLHIDLFPMLERLRKRIGGYPIGITSGYRCPAHNKRVGGARRSRHMQGDAVDCGSRDVSHVSLARAAEEVGFTGIKVYANWVHLDIRPGRPWKVGV